MLLVAAVGAGIWYFGRNDTARNELLDQLDIETSPSDGGALIASGFIEADEVDLAAEIGGRVVTLPFEESDEVTSGDTVMVLDTAILEAQRDQTAAQLTISEAELDLLRAGATDEEIEQAEAQVAIAQASLDAAQVALQGAYAVHDNPQDLDIRVAEAETQVEAAQHQVNAALAAMEWARKKYGLLGVMVEDIAEHNENREDDEPGWQWAPLDFALSPQRYEAAQQHLDDAQGVFDEATTYLAAARTAADTPQGAQSQVASAQTSLNTGESELVQAEAELADLKVGASQEQIRVSESRVEEAEAALEAIETQIERMTISAPINGIVLEQSVHVGELASPGVPVITLADLDTVELTVYIASDQFDKVALHQMVEVSVDSFPDREIEGEIVYIADQAEFTPRNVQTQEERVNLVYAVKIRIENPDHALKPGMPADVRFDS